MIIFFPSEETWNPSPPTSPGFFCNQQVPTIDNNNDNNNNNYNHNVLNILSNLQADVTKTLDHCEQVQKSWQARDEPKQQQQHPEVVAENRQQEDVRVTHDSIAENAGTLETTYVLEPVAPITGNIVCLLFNHVHLEYPCRKTFGPTLILSCISLMMMMISF